ncbi:hypothetical protein JCM10212_001416 [Sporobolomyces blumeae]
MSSYAPLPSESTANLDLDRSPRLRPSNGSTASSPHRPRHVALSIDNSSDSDEKDPSRRLLEHDERDGSDDVDQVMPILKDDSPLSWRERLNLRPRTVVLSILSLSILVLLLVFFHPARSLSLAFSTDSGPSSNPVSYDSSSYYSGAPLSIGLFDPLTGQLAPNPLESDAKFGDAPFAKVGESWDSNGHVPEWAGGDGGANEVEQTLTAGGRRWNGTHWWDPTVILVSIDGMRAEYLERGLTPNLLDTSRKGLRADYLEPVFPSLTFPNHWSMLTGLYPASHGIVSNRFYDPSSEKSFDAKDGGQSWNPAWWGGEPIWATAMKRSLRVASLHFPGPPKLASSLRPTYWYPYTPHYPPSRKLEKVTEWLDMPYSKRPQFVMVYLPEVGNEGTKHGPDAAAVDKALKGVDRFFEGLKERLSQRGLTDVVDVVVVGDHGMTDTSEKQLVYLDEILGQDGYSALTHVEGWPSAGLRFDTSLVSESEMLERLRDAAAQEGSGFDVYSATDMPGEWHFSGNDRIASIYCVPKLGWTITSHDELEREGGGKYSIKGNHGYDPSEPDMHSIFLARGPFASNLTPSSDGDQTTVIPSFSNVELYDFVATLLKIPEEERALNNGTSGFWDHYLGTPSSL